VRSSAPIAVATDVGAWRVLWPALRELERRGAPCRVMLAEPAASIARQDGVEHVALTASSPAGRAEAVLTADPTALLLGTSVQEVVERELTLRARARAAPSTGGRPPIPTLAVLDAMLFVERRFGPDLAALADLVACPDRATACRLRRAGAPAAALVVTGNPTLEEIGRATRPSSATPHPNPLPAGEGVWLPSPAGSGAGGDGRRLGAGWGEGRPRGEGAPTDVLFVSSPVAAMRLRGAELAVDEREALADVLAALAELRALASHGYHVRVRLHPAQPPDRLPPPPPGITLAPDDDTDRLRSCTRARVVVGLSSTLLGEARFLPRAAVAYLPGPFWEREQIFGPEYGVRLARSRDDLLALLAEALREPPDPAPLAGHLGAAARIADLLASLAPRVG
jgi:hypothetical protein